MISYAHALHEIDRIASGMPPGWTQQQVLERICALSVAALTGRDDTVAVKMRERALSIDVGNDEEEVAEISLYRGTTPEAEG